ncbi:hypothetical protein VTJ04DRAFT_2270 [Mycothermus thermophilus]|uniref:uncharacterized protein n=1 Tax=Humicola insolens TaxID=85995 RepID=UPI00374483A2
MKGPHLDLVHPDSVSQPPVSGSQIYACDPRYKMVEDVVVSGSAVLIRMTSRDKAGMFRPKPGIVSCTHDILSSP